MSWARLYLVSPATMKAGTLADLVSELTDAGVDIIQLREKEMEAGDLLRAGAPILSACREAGVPLIVNDRPDVALALGADGVHLGQNDLSVGVARRILGQSVIVGRSTHAEREIDSELAAPEIIDYLSVGPIQQTPTKPGRPGTGLGLVEYAARSAAIPWFVTGGINPESLPRVLEAGATRVVVVRAIVDASDPVETAARLREILDSVPVER